MAGVGRLLPILRRQLYNFNNSPVLLIGVRTPAAKPGVYADWVPDTTDIVPAPSSLNTIL